MFSAINLNINIVRLKSPQKFLTFYLFCLLPSLIPTVKASIVDIIQFPIVDGMSNTTLTCPTDKFSKFVTYDTFGSQTGAFIPILGLLFTVAVYGTTSVFGYMTTCLLDDIVIFTSSLAPILSWYTLVKPIWLIVLINEIRADNNSADKDSNRISLLLIGSFTLILILMALVRYHFRKLRSQIAKHPIPFFNRLKTFVIWIYFFHSLEVITYSFLEYKFVFSNIINSIENNSKLNTTINLLFLNWFMNVCYLFTSLFLVVTYHFPNLEIKIFKMLGIASYINRTNRKFRNFIRKKTFFFTVTLSIGHIFFEYDWFCTPPFISIVFNTILTTVLTRSIASFFSNNGEIKSIHKHMEEKDKVFAQIQPKDIAKVKHFYYKRDDKLEKYSVDPTIVDGHICVYIKDKDDKDHGTKRYRYYFYVAFDGESVYLIDLDLGPIDKNDKEEIRHKINNLMVGGCMDHYCEKIEQKKRDFIINNDKEEKEIKGLVLVNMLETGFLNYIIYSHRSNTDEKEINKNNSTTDNDKSKNDFIIALRINFIIALILTLCALCALYALFVFNNECYYIIIIMAICGLFAVFVLFKLSDDKDDKGDKDAKDDEKLASPV